MRIRILTLLWTIGVFTAWHPVGAAERVLIWRIWPAADMTAEAAQEIEERLAAAARALRPDGVVPAGKQQEFFLTAGSERFLHCGRSLECLADLGNSLEAARVVTGFVRQESASLVTELLVIDSQRRSLTLRTRLRHGRRLDGPTLDRMLQAVFSPERFRGKLRLECPIAGAQVLLDEEPLAFTPLEKPLETAAGLHRLTVRKNGYLEFSRDVDIPPAGSLLVVAVLVALPKPLETKPYYRQWPFWLLVAGGAALTAAGGVLYHDLQTLRENARLSRQAGLARADYWQRRADRRAVESYSCFALGSGALAGAAVIMGINLFGKNPAENLTAAINEMKVESDVRLLNLEW